jgi:MFS family permease
LNSLIIKLLYLSRLYDLHDSNTSVFMNPTNHLRTEPYSLGLKKNWKQFTILVIVNAFVGGMIGMERSIFPQFAESEFGISSHTAVLSFIMAFGFTKALSNYFTGKLANRYGRKNLLVLGWVIALPIPWLLMNATHWYWVIFANILLGISQGLTWSSTVVMKIDLVGEKDRGLAMGLNEFAGYLAVGITAFWTAYIAEKYGITPYPFYLGVCISLIGFAISLFWVKDTRIFVKKEISTSKNDTLGNIFIETSFKNKTLSAVTQAGLVNNLNDGMIWGLFPIILLAMNHNAQQIGLLTAIYPTVWGFGQLITGKMSDMYSKKMLLFWGMFLQGLAIVGIPLSNNFYVLACISVLLGWGTAMVYPTFLSTIAQATSPAQRAESIGTFRLWRDLGYAFGAIISGIVADWLGIEAAVITIVSAVIIQLRMPETTPKKCIEKVEVEKALRQNRKVRIIDVRSKEEYANYHIPNAIHIALSDLKIQLQSLGKDYFFVTVCGKGGGRSSEAAQLLQSAGYQAQWLCGGTHKWLNIN